MISVSHQGKILDVVCKRHGPYESWYVVYLGDILIGQVMAQPYSGWRAISVQNPHNNWTAQGYASRRYAIHYLLRNSGYWPQE